MGQSLERPAFSPKRQFQEFLIVPYLAIPYLPPFSSQQSATRNVDLSSPTYTPCVNGYHSLVFKHLGTLTDEAQANPEKGSSTGWGLQLVTSVSRARVFLLGLICLVISATTGIGWAVKGGDAQTSFTVSSFMTMALTCTIGSLQAVFDE